MRVTFAASGIFVLLFILPSFIHAQNLVLNPSFECGVDECDFTIDAYFFYHQACFWSCPTNGTSDSFSTLIPNKACFSSMPDTGIDRDPFNPHIGSILPRTGSRFAGIDIYSGGRSPSFREYLQAELSSPLIPGEYYCAEMYVAVAAAPIYACNNLGIYFYDQYLEKQPHFNVLPFVPQVNEKKIITQTTWTKISGVFKATSPAKYLTIGNFYDDSETQAVNKGGYYPQAYAYKTAYYFIDDVSVQHLPQKKFSFTGNTEICENETASITALGGLESITWTTLQDTTKVISMTDILLVNPKITTSYVVKGKNCELVVKDTITVLVKPIPQLDIGSDTTICVGSSLTLDAGPDYARYLWGDDSTDRFKTVYQKGQYRVLVTNEFGCSDDDEIIVSTIEKPRIDLGPDSLVCGDFFMLTAGGKEYSYEWSTFSTDSIFLPTGPGTYWVKASNRCGESIDSISLYSFKNFFVPNVLTPNDDDLNEHIAIGLKDEKGELFLDLIHDPQLNVYNRWGELIYANDRYQNDWPDGKENVPIGVYFYTVRLGGCETRKGWLQILR